jgi:protein TonB
VIAAIPAMASAIDVPRQVAPPVVILPPVPIPPVPISVPAPPPAPAIVWPAPVPSDGVRAAIVGNAGDFFGPDAYPPAAIRAEEQGRTVARLLVDESGTTAACEVQSSSGSAELDNATCRIARARLRFTPAHDVRGKALASTYILPVRWVLPEPEPMARTSFALLTRAELTAAGTVISCTTSGSGVKLGSRREEICAEIRANASYNKRMIAPLGSRPATIWVQTALTFDGDTAVVEEHKRAGHTVIALGRMHQSIARDGSITGCEIVEQVGPAGQRPLCGATRDRFAPIATGDKAGVTFLVAFSMAPAKPALAKSRSAARTGHGARRRR